MTRKTAKRLDKIVVTMFVMMLVLFVGCLVYSTYRRGVVFDAGQKACEDVGLNPWHVDVVDYHRVRAFCGTNTSNVAQIINVEVP